MVRGDLILGLRVHGLLDCRAGMLWELGVVSSCTVNTCDLDTHYPVSL